MSNFVKGVLLVGGVAIAIIAGVESAEFTSHIADAVLENDPDDEYKYTLRCGITKTVTSMMVGTAVTSAILGVSIFAIKK